MSEVPSSGREKVPTCPRCNVTMFRVVHVDSFRTQPGLDAYQCRKCGHIVSRLTEVRADR